MLCILLLSLYALNFNINSSNANGFVADEARNLIGKPSSQFPGISLILFVLYGHTDLNVTLKDLFYRFRTKTNQIEDGAIIISNDLSLGGVIIDDSNFVISLIGSSIVQIPLSQINKYFPKGYTMKSTTFKPILYPVNITSAKINTTEFCKNCNYSFFWFDQLAGLLDDNKFWGFSFTSDDMKLEFFMDGYLNTFDNSTLSGTMNPVFYVSNYMGNEIHSFFNGHSNTFNFKLNQNQTEMNFSSSASIVFQSSISNLTIKGEWKIK